MAEHFDPLTYIEEREEKHMNDSSSVASNKLHAPTCETYEQVLLYFDSVYILYIQQ